MAQTLIQINFFLFLGVCAAALLRNLNINTVLVGLTYLAPLVPVGFTPENADRFLIVSFCNLIFGIIEVVVFVLTVKPEDTPFDREHIKQLFGHVLPIVAALAGLSFLGRATEVPVSSTELALIALLFISGSVLRVAAIRQIGAVAFKFDIIFRREQKLKTDQLYGLMRHPSYTAMMIVVLAFAVTAHSWTWGILGMLLAWGGFQYRIHHEEKALAEQFGEEYQAYRSRTGMWFPRTMNHEL
ncbi:hypothetical protein UZ36_02600 [Candidatus Nitromaritima sp. SCGC AAA799-C22]|nr:hypothetical protein UZ36_02600 [Candidatus Nitromaritima sp. SCGC AAA799-C22]